MISDDDEIFAAELFDTSDVTFTIKDGRSRNEVTLIARCDTTLNLVKYTLALREFLEKIELELGIMEAAEGEH